MPTAYSEFDTTPVNLVADVRARILLSSDWTANGATALTATTTSGVPMHISPTGTPSILFASWQVHRLHNGTTGTDTLTRNIYYKHNSTAGATTSNVVLHVVVSAGKDHLFIYIEGPRATEQYPDRTDFGSVGQSLFLGDVVPYFTGQTGCYVVAGNGESTTSPLASDYAVLSRNRSNTTSWVRTRMMTLALPAYGNLSSGMQSNPRAADGTYYLAPWVCFEQLDGLRGRIRDLYHAGATETRPDDYRFDSGETVTVGGREFVARRAWRHGATASTSSFTPYGYTHSTTAVSIDPQLLIPRT